MKNIQIMFLRKLFIKSIKQNKKTLNKLMKFVYYENNNLIDPDNHNLSRFEELKNILLDKDIIESFNFILDKLYRYYKVNELIAPKINSKKFLSSWLLVSFPEFILSKSKKDIKNTLIYPDDIYFISKNMIENFYYFMLFNDKENERKFFKSFNQFSNAINYFLNRDKIEQLNMLLKEYYEINETLKNVKNNESYDIIMNTKNNIFNYINKLDSSITKDTLEEYSELVNLYNKKMEDIEYQLLLHDIRSKKLLFFSSVIEKIKDNLLKLKADKIQPDICDVLDSDFIVRLISYSDTFTVEKVKTYGDYLVNIINQLNSIEKSIVCLEEWKSISYDDPCEFLARMLIFVNAQIYDIFSDIHFFSN